MTERLGRGGGLALASIAIAMMLLGSLAPQDSIASLRVAPESNVDGLVLMARPHGVGYEEARRLGSDAIPRLWEILDDSKYKDFWVNAVVTLGFQENPITVGRLIGFWEDTRRPEDLPTLRAHLAVPFALGSIAARNLDSTALDFLYGQVELLGNQGSSIGIAGIDLVQEDLERMLLGLAVAGHPDVEEKMHDFSQSNWFMALSQSRLQQTMVAFQQAREVAADIVKLGRPAYFSYRPPRDNGTTNWDQGEGVPSPHMIAAKRHIEATYSNADLDADLDTGALRLFTPDSLCAATGGDMHCPVSFLRSADVATFGSVGDGLNTVASSSELNAVFDVGGARVKVVAVLDYCGGLQPTTIGCAQTPGETLILEQGWAGSSVFVHEFGHNRGLLHRDDCVNNIMSSGTCLSCSDSVVNEMECDAYGGNATPPPPPPATNLSPALFSIVSASERRNELIHRDGFE